MKQIIAIFCAVLFSSITTFIISTRVYSNSNAGSLNVSSLILRDEMNRIVARLESRDGKTALTFNSYDGKPSLVLGVWHEPRAQILQFLSKNGDATATLVSTSPGAASTLYLGDDQKSARLILGAIPTDMDHASKKASSEWGLVFKGNSQREYMQLILDLASKPARMGLRLNNDDGTSKSLP